jgi:hypothetical protein
LEPVAALLASARASASRLATPQAFLFALAIAVYLLVRLIRLPDFPIYFFTDEAIQTVLASDLVAAGFRDHLGHYFPMYLLNVYYFNPSAAVYAQLVPYLLLGKSVFLTRAVAVLLTVPGAVAVGLTLRQFFRIQNAWIGVLLLSITPSWFLHSRTAFETTAMVSFYACFLYFYLLYRCRAPAYLYLAVASAALAFYAYSSGQIVVTLTAVVLAVIDARYHRAHYKTVARALLLTALFAAPFVRFIAEQPEGLANALRNRESVWTGNLPLVDKVRESVQAYAQALSPGYWYLSDNSDLPRHLMKGYGRISPWTLPFASFGLLHCLRSLRNPAHRTVLVALLITPMAAAAAGVGITRVLAFVVPATWLASLGIEPVLQWLSRRISGIATSLGLFIVLSALSLAMLRDSLVNGPTWFTNYGLDGMQYGARQVFGAIDEVLADSPGTEIHLSPSWANGTDILARFFLPPEAPVRIENADGYLAERLPLTDDMLFVLTPEEYGRLAESPVVTDVRVERILPYPDGRPGFYFVRMRYSPEADRILAEAEAERRRPVVEEVVVGDQTVQVTHPLFDLGTPIHLFDDDPFTLVRTYEANPARIALAFPQPRSVSAISLTIGFRQASLTVRLFPASGADPVTYIQDYRDLPETPTIEIRFENAPIEVQGIEIELRDLSDPMDGKLHILEISLG